MFTNPSMITRIAIGKGIGFIIGLIAFFMLPVLWPDTPEHIRWGILFWYVTFGAIIGVFGVFTYHPILRLPMPWWIRAPILGAWLNFVMALMMYDILEAMLDHLFPSGLFRTPYWLVVEGAIIGFIIGFVATKLAGEGPETLEEMTANKNQL
jgi:hypothetical protein